MPALSIDDVTATEGNAGTVTYTFTVSLDAPAPVGGVTFDITTAENSATVSDADFVGRWLTGQTIAEGATSVTFEVTVNGDEAIEPDETFLVNVTNIVGATAGDVQGIGTITNDDLPPEPEASIGDVSIAEGQEGVSSLVFTVSLSFAPTGPVTIDYATSDGSATGGTDYLAVSGQLSFAAGETSRTITVPIVGDTLPEGSETLTVTLSNPSGATISDGVATGTIANDDGSAYFPLSSGTFFENWTDIDRITATDDWSGVPFVVGYLGDIDAGSSTGVDPRTLTSPALGEVDVIANQTNPNGQSSSGVAEFQIANPTTALQGSRTADAPSIVLYMDASGRTDVRVQANLRDIESSTQNAVQPINVQYRTDSNGAWINVPGGYFADVTTVGTATQVTALDVTLPPGANDLATLQVRIMTVNAPGSDEWVGIDDIVVTSAAGPASYSIADTAAFEGTGGTSAIGFTVTRAGDSSAAGTANYAITFAGGGFSASAATTATIISTGGSAPTACSATPATTLCAAATPMIISPAASAMTCSMARPTTTSSPARKATTISTPGRATTRSTAASAATCCWPAPAPTMSMRARATTRSRAARARTPCSAAPATI